MKFKPTIAIVLDTRTIHKDGTYPVRIRATFQAIRDTKKIWVRKYYDTGYNFTRGVYEAVMGKTRVEEYKRIAMELKSTRHTFATISINSGARMEFIQEALGHSDLKTTQAYFAGFDKETKRQASERL